VVEKIVEVIKEVEKIVEVPVEVFVEKGRVIPELNELFEDEENYMSADTTTTTTQEGPKVLRYTKNNDQ
jgi:hypothetical protein